MLQKLKRRYAADNSIGVWFVTTAPPMTVLWKKFPNVSDVTTICFTLLGYQRVLLTPGAPRYRTKLCSPAMAASPVSSGREDGVSF